MTSHCQVFSCSRGGACTGLPTRVQLLRRLFEGQICRVSVVDAFVGSISKRKDVIVDLNDVQREVNLGKIEVNQL